MKKKYPRKPKKQKQSKEITRYKRNLYVKNRMKNNPELKLKETVSSKIRRAFKKNNTSKNKQKCLKFLPYTMIELMNHLMSHPEKQDWMTLDNYGWASTLKRTWQIDHIVPQSLLPYTSMEDENFKKCWALENLRPLCAIENIKKSNKILTTK